jgi:hypothetical protein
MSHKLGWLVILNEVKNLYLCNTDVSPDLVGINMTKTSSPGF